MKFNWLWSMIQDTYISLTITWLITAAVMGKNRGGIYRRFLQASVIIYTAILLYVTLLSRTAGTEHRMELSFLWEYRLALQGQFGWWIQILRNIFLFIPMGWLFGAMDQRSTWYKAIVSGCMVSSMIELCQLVFKLGLFEIDDIFNNTIGMIVGYGLYRIVRRIG